MDGRRDSLSLEAKFAVRPTDGLQSLEERSSKASKMEFFVEWEWTILSPEGASPLLVLRQSEPILPPFETEMLPKPDGELVEFVIVRSGQVWQGINEAGLLLPDGTYPFRIDARTVRIGPGRGRGSNREVIDSILPVSAEAGVDNTPPQVTISTPVDGTFVTSTEVTVAGTVTDASPIQSLVVCGQNVEPVNGSFSVLCPLRLGANPVSATATDAAGNEGRTDQIEVVRGVCFPETVESCYDGPSGTAGVGPCVAGSHTCLADGSDFGPCEGQVLPAVEVCNSADDDCNGAVDDGLGSTTCGVGECEHTVANCVGGVPQVCDPLEGALAEICDGLDNDCNATVDDGVPDIVGSGSDVGLCQPQIESCIDGQFLVVQDRVDPRPEVCNDGLDQDCDGEDCVFLEIAIESPAPGTLLNTRQVDVTGTVESSAISVEVNGMAADLGGGLFTALGVPLQEGVNVVTATARREDGVTGTASVEVTVDSQPPVVTIDSPPDELVTTALAVTVTGMINDIVVGTVNEQQATVTVHVNGIPFPAQVANRSFLAGDLPLDSGRNGIVAVGVDRAGNVGTSATIFITGGEVMAEPHIQLISGNNQTSSIGSTLPGPLVVELWDAADNPIAGESVVFRVTENNGTLTAGARTARAVAVTTNAAGRVEARWTLGTRSGAGNNVVEATAVGFAGKAMFTAIGVATGAELLVVDSGSGQVGVPSQPLPRPFVVVVTDAGNNRIPNVPVTFAVAAGGGLLGGSPSVTVATDSDGRALALLTLGQEEGIDNNAVTADFPGNPRLPASFRASALTPGDETETSISGVVLDNSDVPVPGVTVRIGDAGVSTQTDDQGQFSLKPVPVGTLALIVDGSTTVRPGPWPTLEFELVTVAGAENRMPRPVYLLPIDEARGIFVDETTGGTLTLPELPGFSLTVMPDSVDFPDGGQSGVVSATLVHADKVPMVPSFGQQPRFIITIQPAGAHFDPPAPITYPNVDGLAPGEVMELYSFDHDLGQFVAIGTGTVSEDGTVIASDPGVGILKAGWHCGGNPTTGECLHQCPVCQLCNNACVCVSDNLDRPEQDAPDDCVQQVCLDGGVITVPDDGETPPDVPMDCNAPVCMGGGAARVPDDLDVPPSDPEGNCLRSDCLGGLTILRVDDGDTPADVCKTCDFGSIVSVPGCKDTDGDGIPDDLDDDIDGDGIPNDADDDIDGDGEPNITDPCPYDAEDECPGNGVGEDCFSDIQCSGCLECIGGLCSEGADCVCSPDVCSPAGAEGSAESTTTVLPPGCPAQCLPVVQLEVVGIPTIEDWSFAEVTTLKAAVRFPTGHLNAGAIDTAFNGDIMFVEDPGTNYYDGKNGATLLPQSIPATNGVAGLSVKSMSQCPLNLVKMTECSGPKPPDARIGATATGAVQDPSTNPIGVEQWFDRGQNHALSSGPVVDWFEARVRSIFARGVSDGALATVLNRVSRYREVSMNAGAFVQGFSRVEQSEMLVNPFFKASLRLDRVPGGLTGLECGETFRKPLTYTIIHEARHAYQNFLSTVNVGTSSSGLPDNDSDDDFLVEMPPQIPPSDVIHDSTKKRLICETPRVRAKPLKCAPPRQTVVATFKGDDAAGSQDGPQCKIVGALERDAVLFAAGRAK